MVKETIAAFGINTLLGVEETNLLSCFTSIIFRVGIKWIYPT